MAGGDQARVSVRVDVPVADAFDLFTREIDRWWRRGPKFRNAGMRGGLIALEPGMGGRLFESIDASPHPIVYEIGRVMAWEPPRRVQFTWRNAAFSRMIAGWWGEQMSALRRVAAERRA